jgi:hypothetical protein
MFLIHTLPQHAEIVARAVVSACRLEGWQSPVQPKLLHTLFNRLLGQDLDFEKIEPLSPAEVAGTLTTSSEREELIHLMVAIEILCNPIPERLERSVVQWATTLHVHECALLYARDLARGELSKAVHDFYRLNWIGDLDRRSPDFDALLRHAGDKAYALTVKTDDTEASRWNALGSCPPDSIGRSLWEFYRMRGFAFPGQAGSVNVAVAQHDWVHVLADDGTTPMGEIEASGFYNSTTRAPGAMLGLIGVLALFESGLMPASLVVPKQAGHNLSAPGGIERLAEAVGRGAACNTDLLLDVDFFQHANEPLKETRARFAIPPKSPENPRAGSLRGNEVTVRPLA